jgi:hypothetical protein
MICFGQQYFNHILYMVYRRNMYKKTSVIMASAIAGILALAVLAVAIPNQAFASPPDHSGITVAGNGNGNGNGGIGGAGGAGGVGGPGGEIVGGGGNANGGSANGGHGGNANGGSCNGNLNCVKVSSSEHYEG